jgi:hypothetical protein
MTSATQNNITYWDGVLVFTSGRPQRAKPKTFAGY